MRELLHGRTLRVLDVWVQLGVDPYRSQGLRSGMTNSEASFLLVSLLAGHLASCAESPAPSRADKTVVLLVDELAFHMRLAP